MDKILKHKPTGLGLIGALGALIASIFGMVIGYSRYTDKHTEQTTATVYSAKCSESTKMCDEEIRYTVKGVAQKVILQISAPSPFLINQEIPVYYNPKDPTDVVVDLPSKNVALALFIFSLIVFANIGWYLYTQYKIYKFIKSLF